MYTNIFYKKKLNGYMFARLIVATCKRENIQMKKRKEDTKDKTKIRELVIYPLIVSVLSWIIPIGFAKVSGLLSMPDDLAKIESRLSAIEIEVGGIKQPLGQLQGKVELIEDLVVNEKTYTVQLKQEVLAALKVEYQTVKNEYLLSSPTWENSDIIAIDLSGSREYRASELAGEKLFIPYTDEEGNEVLFYGQYDNNNQWDGECLINVYSDKGLILAMDAVYDSGSLVSFEQVSPDKISGQNVWIVSKGVNSGNTKKRESWNYIRQKNFNKLYSSTKVEVTDIISVDTFVNILDSRLESYYNGNISDGKYNDNTGEAYLVKYAEDGTVKLLYFGMFKNGRLEDSSGKAWCIAKADNEQYMYYKGKFKNNDRVSNEYEYPITIERIKEIIKDKEIQCELKWTLEE